jgi:hypothetical protein
MFKNILDTLYFINNHRFESLIIFFILFFLLIGFYQTVIKKQKGTWNNFYYDKSYFFDFDNDNEYKEQQFKINKQGGESKGEIECRRVIEKIFNKPFPKARPNFLNNPVTGGYHNLELDCYNDELGIAVEYNGRQHYEYVPYFHNNKEAFYNQKYRDDMKRRICKDNNIILIEVPYDVKFQNIEKFILNQLKQKYIAY